MTLHVLVVERDPAMAADLKEALGTSEDVGDVHVAPDVDAAIAYLAGDAPFGDRTLFPLPSLIFLDLKPRLRPAFDVLEWMKTRPELRRIPVVALSATRENPDIWKAYQLGANTYLLKPAPREELRTMLKGIQAYWSVLNTPPQGPQDVGPSTFL